MATGALTPYICVRHAQEAIPWYAAALGAVQQGEEIVMPDGKVGHAELLIEGSRLYLSEAFPEIGVVAPTIDGTCVTLHLEVPDVAAAVRRADGVGAAVERQPETGEAGTVAVIRDPFGHRWMLSSS
jgi:uncharacterized glyoxalase superfamily protein PhnB